MQDENGNYFWSSNFTINTNAQKIKAYTTSVTSYSLMMLNKKTSSGTVSDYVAYFDYDQQKNEEVCSIYKIKKKANKNYIKVGKENTEQCNSSRRRTKPANVHSG